METGCIHPSNPDFQFEGLLADSFKRQATIHEHECSTDVEDFFSLSPLTSPDPTPPPSPASMQTALPLPGPSTSTAKSPARVKAGRKRHSHANRRRKRQEARASMPIESAGPRLATIRKHVNPSKPIQTDMVGEEMPISTKGYVAVRQGKTSQVYRLEQLVGKNSRFCFELVEWDGR